MLLNLPHGHKYRNINKDHIYGRKHGRKNNRRLPFGLDLGTLAGRSGQLRAPLAKQKQECLDFLREKSIEAKSKVVSSRVEATFLKMSSGTGSPGSW